MRALKALLLLLFLLLPAESGAGAETETETEVYPQVSGISTSAFGSRTWREPVAAVLSLPLTGNSLGDARMVLDTMAIYGWNGTAWVEIGSSGGSEELEPTWVSSVGLQLPAEFTVTGSPITESGTLTGGWALQTASRVLASPVGSTGIPSFRALAASDIPALSYAGSSTSGGPATTAQSLATDPVACSTGSYVTDIAANGTLICDEVSGGGGVSEHGDLTGLSDDDHAQYANLSGRSGGQVLIGGSASGESLFLQPNSTAGTGNGRICFGTNGAQSDGYPCWYPFNNSGAGGIRLYSGTGGNYAVLEAKGFRAENHVLMNQDRGGIRVGSTLQIGFSSSPNNVDDNGNDAYLTRAAASVVRFNDALRLTPRADPPIACGIANSEGVLYADSSTALCYCDGNTWINLIPTGACS